MAYTNAQYTAAIEKARAAGDNEAADYLQRNQWKAAMLKADEAGDTEVVAHFQQLLGGKAPEPNIAHKGDKKPGDRVPVDLHAPAVQGITSQYGDEAAAGLRAAQDTVLQKMGAAEDEPVGFQEKYDQSKAFLDAQLARTREEHPVASTALEIGGILAVPGAAGAKVISRVPTLAGKIAAGAGASAAESALYRSGEGNSLDERLENAKDVSPLDFAGGVAPLIPAAARGIKGLRRYKVDDAAGASEAAKRLDNLQRFDNFDLTDIDRKAEKGAVAAIKKVQKDLHTEIREELRPIRKYFSEREGYGDPETRRLARNAVSNSLNDVKGHSTNKELAALDRLVGDIRNGARLKQLIATKREIQKLDRKGGAGGVSRYTDILLPFAKDSNLFSMRNSIAGLLGYGAQMVGGLPLVAGQIGIGLAGRGIDKLTGRRALAKMLVDQHLGKAKQERLNHLPDQRDIDIATRRRRAEEAAKDAQAKADQKAAEAQAKADKQAADAKARADQKAAEKAEVQRQARVTKALKDLKKLDTRYRKEDDVKAALEKKQTEEAAAKVERDQQKAFRDKQKMLEGARKGVAEMTKSTQKKSAEATKPVKQSFAKTEAPKKEAPKVDMTLRDRHGNKVKNQRAYMAKMADNIAKQETARQKAALQKDDHVRSVLQDAIADFAAAKSEHSKRKGIFGLAKDKGRTPEEKETIDRILRPLAEMYGKAN